MFPQRSVRGCSASVRIGEAIRRAGIRADGISFLLADGEAAGQEIPHAHLHILPRFAGDGFRIAMERGKPPSREELDRLAEAIGSQI
jgi:diadenosine tetraphosphate (Ap4A) HIT family hydrolase